MNPHNWSERMMDGSQSGALLLLDPGDGGKIVSDGFVRSCALRTGGAETRTVADPKAVGQRLLITLVEDGGDAVVTFDSDIDQSGNNVATFADAGDAVELVAAPTANKGEFVWRLSSNNGTALA